MSLELTVELVALVLALVAACLSMRSAPDLDWERLLKVALSTVTRGEVESAGGEQAQWWARIRGVVPYHPAGRQPEAKLESPDPEQVAVPALEGERALVARLEVLQTPAERWQAMYEGDATQEALLSDPALLGPAYDPAGVLAPDVGWGEVAAWTDTLQDALARRMTEVVVLVVGTDLASPMAQAVPHARVKAVVPASGEILAAAFLDALPGPADRAVIFAGGTDVLSVLQALHHESALRDRVLAVLSLGGVLTGDWIEKNFTHAGMDTELNRATAYMDIVDVQPDAPLAQPWAAQCFPQPPTPSSGWTPIERVGLGPLPLVLQEPVLLARALWVLLAFRLASR